jgi:hypothetical protein
VRAHAAPAVLIQRRAAALAHTSLLVGLCCLDVGRCARLPSALQPYDWALPGCQCLQAQLHHSVHLRTTHSAPGTTRQSTCIPSTGAGAAAVSAAIRCLHDSSAPVCRPANEVCPPLLDPHLGCRAELPEEAQLCGVELSHGALQGAHTQDKTETQHSVAQHESVAASVQLSRPGLLKCFRQLR